MEHPTPWGVLDRRENHIAGEAVPVGEPADVALEPITEQARTGPTPKEVGERGPRRPHGGADATVWLFDLLVEARHARGPRSVGGSPVTIHVYVEDVDATFEQAIDAGATALRPVENKFYGDRGGEFEDPFGHRWSIATHVEDVSPEEMQQRMGQMPG
jgi:uncharacterized glyoxalase superfamily protein PhnB